MKTQSVAQHTPGPWKWTKAGLVASSIKNELDRLIIFEWKGKVGSNNANDENLIAAAPELLEALKAVLESEYINHNGSREPIVKGDLRVVVERAIAKAEGR